MNGLRSMVEAFGLFVQRMLSGLPRPIEVKAAIELPTFWRSRNVKPNGFKPTWIVIHHSQSKDGVTRDWDGIRKYHMSYRYEGEIISQGQYENLFREGKTVGLELPWKDVGYHFGIELVDGKLQVMNGRRIGEVGAHAQGFNSISVGICCVGNYDNDTPSDELLFLASGLCRQLQIEYKIPRDQVIGHRETYPLQKPAKKAQKSCPGTMFDMDKFRVRLRD